MIFGEHLTLLREFLARREAIVEQIDARCLSVRANAAATRQTLEGCFFGAAGLSRDLARLHGQLDAAHLAAGFVPVPLEGAAHDLDPVDLIVVARHHWDQQRRPGRNLRLPYAARVYLVFMLQKVERLSLRVWDEGEDGAAERLQQLQSLLDRLNEGPSPDALVRDACWLLQTAQGALTRSLAPYFTVAERIATALTPGQRLEIHKAGAILTSGHLRSQLRLRAAETGRSIDDPDVLATARNSNSLDGALLVRDLVPLLEAYGEACDAGDTKVRRGLSNAILQGVSADPELFLVRLDLLGPCTMLEDPFLVRGVDGALRYSTAGRRHRDAVDAYAALISRHAASLHEDASAADPRHLRYSPLGTSYGFCADLLSSMMFDGLLSQPAHGLSLEDMFATGGNLEAKRARAEGWKALREREVTGSHVDYSQTWAEQMFDRTADALRARAEHGERANASRFPAARLFLDSAPEGTASGQEHCLTSDLQLALATGATAFPRGHIVTDRNEGRFLGSEESNGKWFAVSKVVLTLCTSRGKDVVLAGVPPGVVEALGLTCPELLARAPG